MSILRDMLESCITLNGVCYYKKCCKFQHKNAKVVQGSSHDVVGAVAILYQQHGQISDNNNTLFNLLKIPKKNYSKILIQELC